MTGGICVPGLDITITREEYDTVVGLPSWTPISEVFQSTVRIQLRIIGIIVEGWRNQKQLNTGKSLREYATTMLDKAQEKLSDISVN